MLKICPPPHAARNSPITLWTKANLKEQPLTVCGRQLGVVLDVCPSSPPHSTAPAALGSARCWAGLKASTPQVKVEVGERLCLEAIIPSFLNLVDLAIFVNVGV